MLSGGAVASFARDRLLRENGITILVVGAGYVHRGSCVTEDATFSDRAGEVWILRLLIAGSQIVRIATLIKSDGRLKKVPVDVD
jgi:hypothetical protein